MKIMKEKIDQIVAHVEVHGDRSVGMFPFSLKVTIEGLDMKRDIEDPMPEGRKEFKEALGELFYEFLDYGGVDVSFDDECVDCGQFLTRRKRGEGYLKHSCFAMCGRRR